MRFFHLIVLFFIIITILTGCGEKGNIENHFHLSLNGESEHWEVENYEVKCTPHSFKAGDGKVTFKSNETMSSDYYKIDVHAVIGEEDKVVQAKSVSGETNLEIIETGHTNGDTYVNRDGEPITFNEVSRIYMVIEWRDHEKRKMMKETIDLKG
ncbi:hypothetical protein [Halobacillus sp. BBL2006]|uniref:hypothetical protein n=1 Tax=Halobacillus sp. BBL2006 TaxID=1543706 RepID=UPI0005437EA2|nr:hypothetical protein [Halobacillus sp. BBL2006]KHE71473.1 hypothetical protein LD39_09590 [Halobacillus sp. BBL2006]